MIKSAVTISLVKEAEGGPFVFWHDLVAGCTKAADLGYDAVEVFAPNADAIPVDELRALKLQQRAVALLRTPQLAQVGKPPKQVPGPQPKERQ